MKTQSPHRGRDLHRFKRAAAVSAAAVAVLWLIALIGEAFDLRLARLGVFPRELDALPAILSAPLIHGSYRHLFANSLPLLVLGTAALYSYPRASRMMIPAVYLGSGLGVWLFARASFHIGASGLTHGLMFFLFVAGILRRDRQSMAIAMIVFFLYGGMVWGIFPTDPDISFEYHFFGAVFGVLAAALLRRRDPLPARRRYSWEGDTEHEDPVIGELWRENQGDTDR